MIDTTLIPQTAENQLFKFKSDALNIACNNIAYNAKNMLTSGIAIGQELSRIKSEKLYKTDFDTFDDFTKKVFNMSKSQRARLMQMANRLLDDNGDLPKELEGFETSKLNLIAEKCKNYKDAIALVKSLNLTPDISYRDLQELLNGKKKIEKKPEQQDSNPEQQNGKSEQQNGKSEQQDGNPEQQNGKSEQQDGNPEQQNGKSEQQDGNPEQQNGKSEQQNGKSEQQDGNPEQQNGKSDQKGDKNEKMFGAIAAGKQIAETSYKTPIDLANFLLGFVPASINSLLTDTKAAFMAIECMQGSIALILDTLNAAWGFGDDCPYISMEVGKEDGTGKEFKVLQAETAIEQYETIWRTFD